MTPASEVVASKLSSRARSAFDFILIPASAGMTSKIELAGNRRIELL
jgi:hypothetical protein